MDHALTISGLTKTYKDFILDQVSLTVPKGSIVGLVGENGAGKSTIINAALGLIQKEAGIVSILGRENEAGNLCCFNPKAMIVPATIDEIMLLYIKGEKS